jgi:uncharacterized membrane protein
LRQYLAASLWVLPLVGAILGAVLGSLESLATKGIDLPASLVYTESTASTVLSAIVGATAALTGFVVTATVLVVQQATSAFSPRYMRLWYRDRLLKVSLALLVGTLAFSFSILRRVSGSYVPSLATSVAALLLILCLLVFLIFLDRVLHRMRPVAVAVIVARYVERDYQRYEAALTAAPDLYWGVCSPAREVPSLRVHSHQPGSVQGIDARGLLRWARARNRLIAVRHSVGDFVPTGAVLFEVYGGEPMPEREERRLRNMIVLGAERTIEQDPAFAIRILVDIAEKALSAAINDPTTAVQMLNHLGDLLRLIGSVDLSGSSWSGEREGRTGIVLPVREWDQYLSLAVTEIRVYGGASLQVMRRLRAMLEEVRTEVLPRNRAAVDEELTRLDATVARHWSDTVDFDRARHPDGQGIGGRLSEPQASAGTVSSVRAGALPSAGTPGPDGGAGPS